MSASQDEIPPPPPPSTSQTPTTQQTSHVVSTIKLPILKKREYDIWAMKMEHYLAHTDYLIWEVIQNGNGPVSITTDTQGQIKVLPPRTAEEIIARERERKARTTLLMALPEDHLAKFHKMTDAKEMWDAIKSRFGGNDESKKMQNQLEIHGAGVSTEDANQKFLRSLPSAWSQVSLIMRTKPGVDSLSFDDLYNNLRVFENDVKGSTASSSSTQNVAFVYENTSSTNDVSIAYSVSNTSCQNSQYEQTSSYSLLVNQSSCPQQDHEDLEQLDEYDLEEMDLKWQVAMISMRMKKFYKKTSRKLQFDAKEPNKGNEGNRRRDAWNSGNKDRSRTGKKEDSKALVAIDGEGVDWTSHSEEEEDYALMACNSSGSDIEEYESDSENEHVSQPTKEQEQPSFASTNKQVKTLAVLTRTGKIPVNTARASGTNNVSTARHNFNRQAVPTNAAMKVNTVKPIVNRVRPATVFYKTHSPFSRPFNNTTALRTNFTKQKVNTAEVNAVSVVGGKRETAVKPSAGCNWRQQRHHWHKVSKYNGGSRLSTQNKGIVDSGCSRHMTGNKAYLAEYQDFNGGPVAFGGSKGYITGKEFKNRDFIEFCGSKGIKREYSNARTPQQNGVAERKNRTLIEAARTMLADSFLPNTFWAKAVSTACYIRRKGPTWLFDLDYLTDSMNYQPVRSENQANKHAGPKEANHNVVKSSKAKNAGEEPNKHPDLKTDEKPVDKEDQVFLDELERLKRQEHDANDAAEALRKDTASPYGGLSFTDLTNTDQDDSEIPALEDIYNNPTDGIFANASYDDEGAVADFTNLETIVNVSPIPTSRINSIHPSTLILGDPKSAVQTRSKVTNSSRAHAFVYRNKKDERGVVVRNKARLVAQGHRQEEGIDLMMIGFGLLWLELKPLGSFLALLLNWVHSLSDDVKSALPIGKIDKEMSSMGELTFFLGLQVKQKEDGIFISQDKYVTKILRKFDFVSVKTASTPIKTQKPLLKDKEASDVNVHLYRSMIGSLMYLTASRPDIMFAVCACSRFQVTPKTSHLSAVKRIFRYLKGKPKLGLWYPRVSSFDLEAYSDSDYAGANLDRKSTTGGCQFLGRRLISWQCKKQTIVATSTTEAEYVAAANCCGQVLWIQNQMLDYGFNFMNTKIYIDNESTICIVKNPVYHSKTKHIAIRHHFIRDAYEKKLIQVLKIHTDDNVADLLTKAFDVSRFQFLVVTIGMINP
ncbi:ribonuclease H-like domain-containing protein [Tanacetum coccineum]